ncbi:DUF998 domain-containing protein [Planococcus salinarum]|uniref:DUF998 domain-containing protein n=1 Tax=Planococcus salinarum TaxID=622695 RepID=UPI000E3C0E82|nr:DUF998 domain-containing protein [Planococcus salinarum]TAA71753.1 DUF998 domain-containing protein [Planococcus salinarum]
MKKITIVSLLIFIFFLIASNGLAIISFPGYSILSNTTSHLGAQGSPYSWIMNIFFISLGLMAILVTYSTRIRYHQVVGAVFGLSLILTGVFPHAPLVDSVPVNHLQDQIHSLSATSTGFSFTLLAAGHGFISTGPQRIAGIVMAIVAVIISIAMGIFPAITGLLQRVMFVGAFGWLFFCMKPPRNRQLNGKFDFD